MSGIDRPTGGDSDPDRYFKREDRPFPAAPADREPVPAPSMDQMRAAYARAGSSAELEAMAKADEAAAARGTRTPDPGSPGERPTAAVGEGADPTARTDAQDEDAAGTAGPESKSNAGVPADRDAGADPPSVDVQHHPGQAPATETHRTGDRGLITYAHAEFHGQKFGAYTDGTHWVSEEAVRAMARMNEETKAPERHGITDLPQQRDLGDNTVGENPDVHLGDTSDLRTFADKMRGEAPFGQNLDDTDSPSESRMGRLLDGIMDSPDDFHDVTGSNTESVADFFLSGPGPTGMHTLQSDRPEFDPAPAHGLNAGDAVSNSILVVAAVATGLRRLAESHRRDR